MMKSVALHCRLKLGADSDSQIQLQTTFSQQHVKSPFTYSIHLEDKINTDQHSVSDEYVVPNKFNQFNANCNCAVSKYCLKCGDLFNDNFLIHYKNTRSF